MDERSEHRPLAFSTLLAIGLAMLTTSALPEMHKLIACALCVGTVLLVLRPPLHLASAMIVAPIAVAAFFALEPSAAWLGSLERAEGLLAALTMATMTSLGAAMGPQARQTLYRGLVGLGVLVALHAASQRIGWHWPHDQATARPASTFSNSLGLAGFFALSMPLALLLWWRHRSLSWLSAAVLSGIGLFATGTRSAWLALAVVTAGAAVAIGVPRRWRIALAIAGAALFALVASTRIESLHDRVELWQRATQATTSDRPVVDLHGAADRYHVLRALVGFGPDQVGSPLQQIANIAPRDAAQDLRADRAHQWLLDRWLATGALGFLMSVLLTAWVAIALWSRCRGTDRAEALALGTALAAYAVHLQFSFATLPDRAVAYVLVGCALACAPGANWAMARGARTFGAALLLFVAVSMLPEWRSLLAPRWAAQEAFEAGQSSYVEALRDTAAASHLRGSQAQFERAIALSRYDIDAALAAASAAVELALIDGDKAALDRAVEWERAVTQIRPGERRLRALRDRIAMAQSAISD